MKRYPWILALLVGVIAQAIAASQASANHIPGATYSGPAATGGSVELQVSGDGDSVSLSIFNIPTTCGNTGDATEDFVPISATANHAFTQATPPMGSYGLGFDGSFPAPGQAAGTLRYRTPACLSASVAWSATVESEEGGGRRKPGEGSSAKAKCKKIKNKKKRKKCLKKLKKHRGGKTGHR